MSDENSLKMRTDHCSGRNLVDQRRRLAGRMINNTNSPQEMFDINVPFGDVAPNNLPQTQAANSSHQLISSA